MRDVENLTVILPHRFLSLFLSSLFLSLSNTRESVLPLFLSSPCSILSFHSFSLSLVSRLTVVLFLTWCCVVFLPHHNIPRLLSLTISFSFSFCFRDRFSLSKARLVSTRLLLQSLLVAAAVCVEPPSVSAVIRVGVSFSFALPAFSGHHDLGLLSLPLSPSVSLSLYLFLPFFFSCLSLCLFLPRTFYASLFILCWDSRRAVLL